MSDARIETVIFLLTTIKMFSTGDRISFSHFPRKLLTDLAGHSIILQFRRVKLGFHLFLVFFTENLGIGL